MWNLHGSIFYIGMRKWVYHVDAPSDIDSAIERIVDGLYLGAKALIERGASAEAWLRRRTAASRTNPPHPPRSWGPSAAVNIDSGKPRGYYWA